MSSLTIYHHCYCFNCEKTNIPSDELQVIEGYFYKEKGKICQMYICKDCLKLLRRCIKCRNIFFVDDNNSLTYDVKPICEYCDVHGHCF